MEKLFWEIHSNLDIEGPGLTSATKKAFEKTKLSSDLRILDLGCGPGRQSVDLAEMSNSKVIAVDNHEPFLEHVRRRAEQKNISNKVKPVKQSMFELNFEEKSFDLIWSEGAIYIIGFEKGIKEWKKYLKSGGYLVASHIMWKKENRPDELVEFWESEAPGMLVTNNENIKVIKKSGYEYIDSFILGKEGWEAYYTPIRKKLANMRKIYGEEKEAVEYINIEEKEIEIFDKYNEYYDYAFYIMKNK